MVVYYLLSVVTAITIILLEVCLLATYDYLIGRRLPRAYVILWFVLVGLLGAVLAKALIFGIYPRMLFGLGGYCV